jgi:hypothetical protein
MRHHWRVDSDRWEGGLGWFVTGNTFLFSKPSFWTGATEVKIEEPAGFGPLLAKA